jgi:hypothetical protein
MKGDFFLFLISDIISYGLFSVLNKHGFDLVVWDGNGFINVTNLFKDSGYNFEDFIGWRDWRTLLVEFYNKNAVNHHGYSLDRKGMSSNTKGWYVHPKLANSITKQFARKEKHSAINNCAIGDCIW